MPVNLKHPCRAAPLTFLLWDDHEGRREPFTGALQAGGYPGRTTPLES
jgi:hypothetical protein